MRGKEVIILYIGEEAPYAAPLRENINIQTFWHMAKPYAESKSRVFIQKFKIGLGRYLNDK